MFRTYKSAEFEAIHLFGTGFQMWHYVEISIHKPWLYVGTRDSDDDEALTQMIMIFDIKILEHLLSESSDYQIESLQLISPSHVNGTTGWVLEDIYELITLGDRAGRIKGYRCLLKDRKSYDVLNLGTDASEVHPLIKLYSRT